MAALDLKSFVLGAALAGGGVGLAAVDDAKQRIRDLSSGVVTHRFDISVADDGSMTADIHQSGALTADAIAAGAQPISWVVDDVVCQANTLQVIEQRCPNASQRAVPEAFKTP